MRSSQMSSTTKEKPQAEANVNGLLKKIKKVEEKDMKAEQTEEGQTLDNIFKQLVSQRATYINNEIVEDPIEQSYF